MAKIQVYKGYQVGTQTSKALQASAEHSKLRCKMDTSHIYGI